MGRDLVGGAHAPLLTNPCPGSRRERSVADPGISTTAPPTLPSLHSCSDRVISNLAEYGNTSAASIPLALDEAVRAGTIKQGDVVAIAGFGAGLSWAAAILRWG